MSVRSTRRAHDVARSPVATIGPRRNTTRWPLGPRKLTDGRSKPIARLLYGLWWVPGSLWGEPGLIQNLPLQLLIDVRFDQIAKRKGHLVVFAPAAPGPLFR